MDSSFESLVHITPWTKAVAFITSQLYRDELIGEYFLLLIYNKGQLRKEKQGYHYLPNALKLACHDGDYVKYGLEEMRSQVTSELTVILSEMFCQQTSSGILDPRCYRLSVETPTFRPATMTTLAMILPEERELDFVYRTRNDELKQFLAKIFLIKKAVGAFPIE